MLFKLSPLSPDQEVERRETTEVVAQSGSKESNY